MIMRAQKLLCPLALLGLLAVSCQASPDGSLQDPRTIVLDRTAADAQLDVAIKQLKPESESVDFWARIANDPTYPDYHRRACILQLFRQHISTGMTLGDIAQALDHPRWLDKENIERVHLAVGPFPLHLIPGDSTFAVRVLPQPNRGHAALLYLRVQGELTTEQLFQAFKNGTAEQGIAERVLREVAVSEYKP
jgi:hypothetical protein